MSPSLRPRVRAACRRWCRVGRAVRAGGAVPAGRAVPCRAGGAVLVVLTVLALRRVPSSSCRSRRADGPRAHGEDCSLPCRVPRRHPRGGRWPPAGHPCGRRRPVAGPLGGRVRRTAPSPARSPGVDPSTLGVHTGVHSLWTEVGTWWGGGRPSRGVRGVRPGQEPVGRSGRRVGRVSGTRPGTAFGGFSRESGSAATLTAGSTGGQRPAPDPVAPTGASSGARRGCVVQHGGSAVLPSAGPLASSAMLVGVCGQRTVLHVCPACCPCVTAADQPRCGPGRDTRRAPTSTAAWPARQAGHRLDVVSGSTS